MVIGSILFEFYFYFISTLGNGCRFLRKMCFTQPQGFKMYLGTFEDFVVGCQHKLT